jgi:hypothetical protein
MSVLSLKRLTFSFVTLLLLVTPAAFSAAFPSARHHSGFVYDPGTTRSILFGGESAFDSGTKRSYDLGDTWEWTGARWIQRFPSQSPSGRSAFGFVWDSNHARAILFGGRDYLTFLNDTWSYANGQWSKIATPNAPPVRRLVAMSYDPLRDRTVLFGGSTTSVNVSGVPTTNQFYDTWEFDGTTWVQRQADGPHVVNAITVYDAARNKTYMLAQDTKFATKMYAWDAAGGSWSEVTGATLPPCEGGGALVYDPNRQRVLFTGGGCADLTNASDTYEWTGTTWSKITLVGTQGPLGGHAMVYDIVRDRPFIFGGIYNSSLVVSSTQVYDGTSWFGINTFIDSPEPRSRFSFVTDAVHGTIWMYGGLNESGAFYDLWRYSNGGWAPEDPAATNYPSACYSPAAAFDSDRQKLVIICQASDLYEFDGTTWTHIEASKFKDSQRPPFRNFSSASYDPKLKKTILFGGYDDTNYLDQTWTWDGTVWARQKNKPPTQRALAALFYDPVQQKTILYGGVGRLTSNDRITRYDDTWSFDGTGWTEVKPANSPGARYGMQVASNPSNGHGTLFGGLRFADATLPALPVQYYVNDQWEWDGSNWIKADASNAPSPRENGGMAVDPVTGKLTIFAGYAGTYMSDTWVLENGVWRVQTQTPVRRRIVRH